ncbi:MAG: DEAD/DEAH box helicase, partial [Gammaproteobacteria bacterium]
MSIADVSTNFTPGVAAWFEATFAAPTEVQAAAWPVIASGAHALITAPTGSGKTLTAFLWALDRFAAGDLATGATRVLYVSPLKALNTDIRTNLEQPLAALAARGTLPPLR